MATKKTSTKFDTAHNIETEADLTNKTAVVKNLVTGETYQGGGGGGDLPTPTAADVGKSLTVQMVDGTPTWVAEEYPGWDVVIKGNGSFYDDTTTYEYLKGSYAIALNKLTNNAPLSIMTMFVEEDGAWSSPLIFAYNYVSENMISGTFFDGDGEMCNIGLHSNGTIEKL